MNRVGFIGLGGLLLTCSVVSADIKITNPTFAAGGTSASASFRIDATLGESFMGRQESSSFSILAGFWGSEVEVPCPADLNGDGLVDFSDYLEFLNLYDAGDVRVDFNGDGLVDFSDYLEFLNLYDAGC